MQVYQEKAIEDKERYRVEMSDYRERLRTGQVISNAVPLQQRFPEPQVGIAEANVKINETEGTESQTLDNESSSSRSDFEDNKDSDAEASLEAGVGGQSSLVGKTEMSTEEGFELRKPEENVGDNARVEKVDKREEIFGDTPTEINKE